MFAPAHSFRFKHVGKLSRQLLAVEDSRELDCILLRLVTSIESIIQTNNRVSSVYPLTEVLKILRNRLDSLAAFLLPQRNFFRWSPLWKVLHEIGWRVFDVLDVLENRQCRSEDDYLVAMYAVGVQFGRLDITFGVTMAETFKKRSPHLIDRQLVYKDPKEDLAVKGLKLIFWSETRIKIWRNGVEAGGSALWAKETVDWVSDN